MRVGYVMRDKEETKTDPLLLLRHLFLSIRHVPNIVGLSVTKLMHKRWSTTVIFNNFIFERGQ
jgi:hypothetical protein